jgi:hypothetical protein
VLISSMLHFLLLHAGSNTNTTYVGITVIISQSCAWNTQTYLSPSSCLPT